jgi:hypothetical protein
MAGKSGRARPHAGRTPGMASCAAGPASAATRPRTAPEWPQDDGTPRIASSRRTGFGARSRRIPRPVLPDKPGLPRPEGGGQSWLAEHCRCPGGVLDFEPTGSAAAFVPVEFPDLVRHGEGRFEAAERELAGPCDQLLAVCPVLVSAPALQRRAPSSSPETSYPAATRKGISTSGCSRARAVKNSRQVGPAIRALRREAPTAGRRRLA